MKQIIISVLFISTMVAQGSGDGLDFDGSDDYVTMGNVIKTRTKATICA